MNESKFLKEMYNSDMFKNITFEEFKEFHNNYLNGLVNEIIKNKHVKLRGFGTFQLKDIKGCIKKIGNYNVVIPSKKVIKFKVSRILTQNINK